MISTKSMGERRKFRAIRDRTLIIGISLKLGYLILMRTDGSSGQVW